MPDLKVTMRNGRAHVHYPLKHRLGVLIWRDWLVRRLPWAVRVRLWNFLFDRNFDVR